MGTLVLILAFIVEAAFAAYCMITRSNQVKARNTIRVAAFAAFIVFTLASVIRWSFRWYLLAALLLVWGVLGAWRLAGKQAKGKEYRTARTLGRAFGALLLIFIVLIPALIFPQYQQPPVTGKYTVATVQYTYIDASRIETFADTGENREVNVEFWYPADATAQYPLVVFDHGAFGMKTSNTSTFMDLTSNGYVVCSIDHPYHSLLTIDADRHLVTVNPSFYKEVADVNNGKYEDAADFQIEKKWMQLRITDIHFVLDTILAQAQDAGSDPVYQLIDPGKIGLMGHSLGGESSAQVARERSDIQAVVSLDSDLGGEYLDYVDGRYVLNDTPYPVPILTILADDMVRLLDAIPDADTVVAVQHVTATAPNAFEIHLAGTDHMSVTDLPLVSPLMVSMINSSVPKGGGVEVDPYATLVKMNAAVLEFFNVYLKGEGSFIVEETD